MLLRVTRAALPSSEAEPLAPPLGERRALPGGDASSPPGSPLSPTAADSKGSVSEMNSLSDSALPPASLLFSAPPPAQHRVRGSAARREPSAVTSFAVVAALTAAWTLAHHRPADHQASRQQSGRPEGWTGGRRAIWMLTAAKSAHLILNHPFDPSPAGLGLGFLFAKAFPATGAALSPFCVVFSERCSRACRARR